MHDPACQDVAEHFLADESYTQETATAHERRVYSLAETIQEAIENWLEANPALPAPKET